MKEEAEFEFIQLKMSKRANVKKGKCQKKENYLISYLFWTEDLKTFPCSEAA